MKKKVLSLVMVVMCLTGCSDGSDVDDILGKYEKDKIDIKISNEWDGVNYDSGCSDYEENAQGFYYYDASVCNMKYVSKEAEVILTLCTKIDCDHILGDEDGNIDPSEIDSYISDCNAIYYALSDYQLYNGELYVDVDYMEGSTSYHPLIKASMDGTTREMVIDDISVRRKELENKATESGGRLAVIASSINWQIYQNKVYIISEICIQQDGVTGTSYTEKVYIDVYDLETGHIYKELFFEEYNCDEFIPVYMDVSDGTLAFVAHTIKDNTQCQYIMKIDVESGKYAEAYFTTERLGYFYMDDKIIFGKPNGDVYTYDAYGNEEKIIELTEAEREIGMYYRVKGDYIMLMNRVCVDIGDGTMGYYVKIYDKEYNYLDTMYYTENICPQGGGHDVILFESRDGSGECYYINTSDIGTGNIELRKYKNI